MTSPSIRIAVDIGGTFTDIEILDSRTGAIHQMKTPSTPSDPSIGLLTGIREASRRFGFSLDEVQYLLHGTTIATNAVLERKLPLGAVVTTEGFEDVMQIGRHGRTDVYAITASPPAALVKRRFSFGVVERIGADGRVITPLDEVGVTALAGKLRQAGVKSLAVCFINAYANPAHERRTGEILRELLPEVDISLSCDISPELREYERMSTTTLNALLVPVVKTYTDRLAGKLKQEVPQTQVYLVQSNGGVAGLAKAGREPARLLLSGPSGGAAAAKRLSAALAEPNLVAVDMGGTSFDVSVVHEGNISMVNEGEVDGLPVRLPMIEMRTIGAGGGSIAWVDEGGRLRIGPHSAGAEPGPACYGRGGARLTVTDANLLLGRLDGSSFMGGGMGLDKAASARAAAEVSGRVGLSAEETAAGVIAVTNSSLATAIRLSLFEKGMDPEDFALLSFGGAGGVHACEVAEEMGMNKVIFPAHASTLSAWGILWSDITHDLSSTQIGLLADQGETLAARAAQLAAEGDRLLEEDGVAPQARAFSFALDLRYQGQAFDLRVPLDEADFSPEGLARTTAAFHALHRQRFSYDEPAVPVEAVALRLSAIGRLAKPTPAPEGSGVAAAEKTRPVYGRGGFVDTRIVARGAVTAEGLAGPAVVEETYTATYLPAGWTIRSHATGALIAERARRH
ncbi:hydantoinase/oxoprolinase family protein [Aquabacter sp. L1I39]|uniref:hydantoinase/oxoprolinase family protein n=1 Tax=Aquabacter sp. L1I39 TaxID=2820278 RepID=UPI001AD9D68A|nr:hydantoinase/oxoprolinase family protein [Aquabacter sp. L1I39]QTL02674.1 hydantoinase/oxoprolinase family protein [Aquabacter sp. L1I39]